ncbi:MAG TPA: gluconokinase [Rhodopseudomonas sp.]|uniref:gluconokinase n=1 Tax=Rhodopseudomonas sp. TaxID=1078 RepID=UPI002EDB5E21
MPDEPRAWPSVLIVMGVSGSGKSTIAEALAQRLGWVYEDADRFHPPGNVAKMRAGQPLTDADRAPWLQAIADEIDRIAAAKDHAVIACSALKRSYRDVLRHGRGDVRLVYLDGDRQLIAARLAARQDHFMPPGLLDSQFATLQVPLADEQPITVAIDRPVEAIVEAILRKLPCSEKEVS